MEVILVKRRFSLYYVQPTSQKIRLGQCFRIIRQVVLYDTLLMVAALVPANYLNRH